MQVKACRQYPPTLCSADWSDPFPLGTPVAIELPGLDAVETVAPQGCRPGAGLLDLDARADGPAVPRA